MVLLFLLVVASSFYDYISAKVRKTSDYLDNLPTVNHSSGNYNSGVTRFNCNQVNVIKLDRSRVFVVLV